MHTGAETDPEDFIAVITTLDDRAMTDAGVTVYRRSRLSASGLDPEAVHKTSD